MSTKCLPLFLAEDETPLIVQSVRAGAEAQARLRELGIITGKQITIMARQSHGPMVLAAKDTRIALDFALCAKVFVTPDQAAAPGDIRP